MSSEIDAEEARQLIDDGATVVDVRTQEEFREGHIPGSIHAPMDSFAGHLGEMEGREPIVMVCELGEASRQAAMLLDAYGGVDASEVYNLRDGLVEWDGELVQGEH